MKKAFLFIIILHGLSAFSFCKNNDTAANEKGIVKGRITDAAGTPIANAKVVIEHTIFHASYVYATSDANGYYKVAVPAGSWQASVQIDRNYLGRLYKFDLSPDNSSAFTGTAGAIRNFTWKLQGNKPQGGYYGNNVAVYSEPGSSFMMEDVQLTLLPDGPLADGSTGKKIVGTLEDVGGGEDGIKDIPLGKYIISAYNKTTKEPLQIRLRNKGEYVNTITGIFVSGFTGNTGYQIVVQVK
jgi:hypothetical protein